jgi:hypothetical protein
MTSPAEPWSNLVNACLQGGTLLVALASSGVARWTLGLALAAVALTAAVAGLSAMGGGGLSGTSGLLSAAVLLIVIVVVVRGFGRTLVVSVQSIMGALCVYVLIGMFFATIYGSVGRLSGAEFFAGHAAATGADYLYFSFITLATVGYGDLAPITRLGRTLAVVEGLMGQLYPVTVVALLVGNLGRPRSPRG